MAKGKGTCPHCGGRGVSLEEIAEAAVTPGARTKCLDCGKVIDLSDYKPMQDEWLANQRS